MKNWLSKIFGGQKESPPPLADTTVSEAARKAEGASLLRNQYEDLLAEAKQALASGRPQAGWVALELARTYTGFQFSRETLDLEQRIRLRGIRKSLRGVRHVRTFPEESKYVESVVLSEDGRRAVSGDIGGTLRLWDVSSGKHLRELWHEMESVNSVALSADGRWALAGGRRKRGVRDNTTSLLLWEAGGASGFCGQKFEGFTDSVNYVALSADGRWALSGGATKESLRLWEVSTKKCLRTFERCANGPVESVALSVDGRWALSGSYGGVTLGGELKLWEVSSGKCLRTFKKDADMRSMDVLERSREIRQPKFGGHRDRVTSVALSVDGRWALSGSNDKTLKLWEVSSGKCLRTFEGHTDKVESVALSADGQWAVSGSQDKTLRLWDMNSGKRLWTFEGHTDGVESVALSADGRWVLSGGGRDTLRLWELDWDCEFPEPADWDEDARPYLETFLTLHCPIGADDLSRAGKPQWGEEDFQKLLVDLQYRGYGWLRPEGVRRQLEKMTAEWQGPPPVPKRYPS